MKLPSSAIAAARRPSVTPKPAGRSRSTPKSGTEGLRRVAADERDARRHRAAAPAGTGRGQFSAGQTFAMPPLPMHPAAAPLELTK